MIEAYEPFKDCQLVVIKRKYLYYYGELEPKYHLERTLMLLTWLDIRNIQIYVYDVERHFRDIPSLILHNAQFVSLLGKDLFDKEDEKDEEEEEPHVVPVHSIRRILSSTPKVTHLQLDLQLLMVKLNDVFRSNHAIVDNLQNVVNFYILGWDQYHNTIKNTIAGEELMSNVLESFDQLASIFRRLESLHLPMIVDSQEQKLQPALVRLLEQNHESLRELSLHFRLWDNLRPVTLPCLRSLRARVGGGGHDDSVKRQQDSLKDFLAENQNSLVELDVEVVEGSSFRKNLFDVIRQRSPYLKKLHLKAHKFVDVDGKETMTKVDWSFLRGMKLLQDFQLSRPSSYGVDPNYWEFYGTGTLLLESLPRNQLLERLCLRGIGAKTAGFWNTTYVNVTPELKLDLFRGFRNLKVLSLRHCPDAVDDDIMQLIVEEMTSLEELEVSHC